jgi:hypothetical protein
MEKIEVPKDWEKMNWSQKIVWLFDKQRELERGKNLKA